MEQLNNGAMIFWVKQKSLLSKINDIALKHKKLPQKLNNYN